MEPSTTWKVGGRNLKPKVLGKEGRKIKTKV